MTKPAQQPEPDQAPPPYHRQTQALRPAQDSSKSWDCISYPDGPTYPFDTYFEPMREPKRLIDPGRQPQRRYRAGRR